MIRRIKNIVWKLLIKLNLGGAIQLMLTGGLLEDGWFKSFNTKQSVDINNKPIPWCTYSFIKFIEPRLKKNFTVFEFGSGNSTLWYSNRVKNIISVESDKEWFNFIFSKLPQNAHIIFKRLDYNGEYCRSVNAENTKFNLIIIDGRDRINCIKCSVDSLAEDGVIIFDNADLPKYLEGINHLKDRGFKKIDFIGISPVTPHNNCTSVFYKYNNCLNI